MPKPIANIVKPFWSTTDRRLVRLYNGSSIDVLRSLPAESVQCVVTSPPYWGLRDYGVPGQLGNEKTPREFCDNLVAVFEQVRRVLRNDGTLWLNIGDTYASKTYAEKRTYETVSDTVRGVDSNYARRVRNQSAGGEFRIETDPGVPAGTLVGIPWMLAFALRDSGWRLRQDIIWHKPSPMPESCRNRCTKAHEYIFLFAKGKDYFYDIEAVKEKSEEASLARYKYSFSNEKHKEKETGSQGNAAFMNSNINEGMREAYPTRNKRSVWTVASESYDGAHFATFPQRLIEPCVLAGTSEYGSCARCGCPYRREVDAREIGRRKPERGVRAAYAAELGQDGANSLRKGHRALSTSTVGWSKACSCDTESVVPCTVLDPFIGSGTTCVVSAINGRRSIGIDLSASYLRDNAIPRIQGAILDTPAIAHLAGIPVNETDEGEDLI